jgi:serine/threonine protein kinase
VGELPLSVGRYHVVRALGTGGFGQVFEAVDPHLERHVAIKRLLAAQDEAMRERFLREARAVAALDHPNIVRVFDAGVDDEGAPFIVQELLQGQTLSSVLTRGRGLALNAAVRILAGVARGLQAAHAAGIIHRDVKPSNIFLTSTVGVKVIDFGIAALTDPEISRLTAVGFVGTPAYASPEQLRSEHLDERTDIFSLGAVAFETLTGRRAFEGNQVYDIIRRVMEEPAPALGPLLPDCPPALTNLVQRCLERNPIQRPASMSEVVTRLDEIERSFTNETIPWPVATAAASPPSASPVSSVSPTAAEPAPIQGTMVGPVIGIREPHADATVVDSPDATVVRPSRTSESRARPTPAADPFPRSGLKTGDKVGRYTIAEFVAPGQTGHLYKAFDPVRSKLVGLKVIENPTGPIVQRLLRSSRIWLELHHPHLQRLYEVDPGDRGGPALITTQLLEGMNLAAVLKQNRLDLAEKIAVTLQVCDALDYMHRQQVVHREVTPRNIVISLPDLHVTLLDSGLARSNENIGTSFTVTGVIVGDGRYMSPEQRSERFDQRSDVYSLGVVLYEMVMGREVEAGELAKAPRELAAAAHLPKPLVAALTSALQVAPEKRCPSVREFSDMLRVLVPERAAPIEISKVVVTLHGIRTHAGWQRAFSEVAGNSGLQCRLDRWNFGRFSLLKFLLPQARTTKVEWFRTTYTQEFSDLTRSVLSSERPSIVAHSFGTYILGYALLRYPYLRFNKVLLCGSILPRDFPWDALIDRGQVQAVRNEYGARDVWTHLARRFVAGTGTSGTLGFSCQHDRLEQEAFDYAHSEYFERGHMGDRWVPFLRRTVSHITPREHALEMPAATRPWGLWVLYALFVAGLLGLTRFLI